MLVSNVAENQGDGGGIHIELVSHLIIRNSRIQNNDASSSRGGFGIWGSSTAQLDNVVIANNDAGIGGGIVIEDYAQVTLTNCTVTANQATGIDGGDAHAGGILVDEFGEVVIEETIIAFNDAASGAGGIHNVSGTATVAWTDLWANTPIDVYGFDDPVGVDGNVSVDPLFLDTAPISPLDWDLHLDIASSLIDSGSTTATDPDGTRADMGAYAGPGADSWDIDGDLYDEWWQPGPYDFASYPQLDWDCDDSDSDVFPGTGC